MNVFEEDTNVIILQEPNFSTVVINKNESQVVSIVNAFLLDIQISEVSESEINLGISSGEKGERGEQGVQGVKGDKGDKGEKGDSGGGGGGVSAFSVIDYDPAIYLDQLGAPLVPYLDSFKIESEVFIPKTPIILDLEPVLSIALKLACAIVTTETPERGNIHLKNIQTLDSISFYFIPNNTDINTLLLTAVLGGSDFDYTVVKFSKTYGVESAGYTNVFNQSSFQNIRYANYTDARIEILPYLEYHGDDSGVPFGYSADGFSTIAIYGTTGGIEELLQAVDVNVTCDTIAIVLTPNLDTAVNYFGGTAPLDMFTFSFDFSEVSQFAYGLPPQAIGGDYLKFLGDAVLFGNKFKNQDHGRLHLDLSGIIPIQDDELIIQDLISATTIHNEDIDILKTQTATNVINYDPSLYRNVYPFDVQGSYATFETPDFNFPEQKDFSFNDGVSYYAYMGIDYSRVAHYGTKYTQILTTKEITFYPREENIAFFVLSEAYNFDSYLMGQYLQGQTPYADMIFVLSYTDPVYGTKHLTLYTPEGNQTFEVETNGFVGSVITIGQYLEEGFTIDQFSLSDLDQRIFTFFALDSNNEKVQMLTDPLIFREDLSQINLGIMGDYLTDTVSVEVTPTTERIHLLVPFDVVYSFPPEVIDGYYLRMLGEAKILGVNLLVGDHFRLYNNLKKGIRIPSATYIREKTQVLKETSFVLYPPLSEAFVVTEPKSDVTFHIQDYETIDLETTISIGSETKEVEIRVINTSAVSQTIKIFSDVFTNGAIDEGGFWSSFIIVDAYTFKVFSLLINEYALIKKSESSTLLF